MITDDDIMTIQLIAKEEHEVELSKQEALDLGERFLAMWRAIYKPIPNENVYEHRRPSQS